MTQAELATIAEKVMNGKDSDVDDVQTSGSEAEDDVVEREEIDSEDVENMSSDHGDDANSPQPFVGQVLQANHVMPFY